MIELILLSGFLIFGYLGYKIAVSIYDLIIGKPKTDTINFIDNSVHYHEHKNLTINENQLKK